jgi:hypothetical protein
MALICHVFPIELLTVQRKVSQNFIKIPENKTGPPFCLDSRAAWQTGFHLKESMRVKFLKEDHILLIGYVAVINQIIAIWPMVEWLTGFKKINILPESNIN